MSELSTRREDARARRTLITLVVFAVLNHIVFNGSRIAVSLYAVAVGPAKAYVEKQKLQRCAENLRKLHMSLSLYANEHDGAYPAAAGARDVGEVLSLLVPKYTADTSLFACPGAGKSSNARGDFAYAMGLTKDAGGETLLLSDAQVNADEKRRGTNIFAGTESGPGSNHGKAGGNVIFCDGHVETIGAIAPRDFALPPGARLLNPTR